MLNRPSIQSTTTEKISPVVVVRERHGKARVQFNLGTSSVANVASLDAGGAGSSAHKTYLRIPEQLRTHGGDYPLGRQGAAAPPPPPAATMSLLEHRRSASMDLPGRGIDSSSSVHQNLFTAPAGSATVSSAQIRETNVYIAKLTKKSSLRTTHHYRPPDTESVTQLQLLPKSKLKGSTTLARRNLSKVSFTYQAVIRPSSPSYMASTSSSRNRASKQSGGGGGGGSGGGGSGGGTTTTSGNSKTGSIRELHRWDNNKGPFGGSSSSHSSNNPGILKEAGSTTKAVGVRGRHSSGSGRKGKRRSRFRLSVSHHDFAHHTSSTVSVVLKEKFLMKIFSSLSWNELLAIRNTCKKWYEIISTEAPLKKEGVIILRRNLEGMAIFNKSLYVWTQFRIFVSVVFDFTDPMQQEFWSKHGQTMSYLELRNSSMTLSALVEILSRCPNLEHFSVTWTAEMYSFNSEMIKKYYGIHFRNGTFVKLHELIIDKSYFLTDNALWSLLKWCGGSIHKLALTCGPEDHEDSLSRLRPRWSIEPIQNYTSRFGYSGNFKFLDFSGSSLNSEDLKTLVKTERLNSLTGIRLSSCKINDEAVLFFIEKKGSTLEELYLDNTTITEKAFSETSSRLPKLRALNISGKKGNFHSLDFLPYLRALEELFCSDTSWLTYTTLVKPLEALSKGSSVSCHMKTLDISSSHNIISRVDQRMNKVWFSYITTILPRVTELNLNYCGGFGNDDNFRAICTNIPTMKKLSVRDWTALTDEALVGMTFDDIIKQYDDLKGFWKTMDTPLKFIPVICNLKNLKFLDLGGCKKLTDICVQFAIYHLPKLTKLSLDRSQVTDASYNLLVSRSNRLEKISFQNCEHITPKGNYCTKANGRLVFLGKI